MKSAFKRVISLVLVLAMCTGIFAAVPVYADFEDDSAMVSDELALGQLIASGSATATVRAIQQRYGNFNKVTLTGADNQKVVQTLRAQLGLTGKQLNYTEQWCADFSCDVAHYAGISTSVVPWTYSGLALVVWLYDKMLTCGATVVTPQEAQPGDYIFFDWGGTKKTYSLDHVAIVVWYDKDTNEITYIGGNQGDESSLSYRSVTERIYDADSKYIAKVLHPNYATVDNSEPTRAVHVNLKAEGKGTVEGEETAITGQTTTVKATPDKDYHFAGWYDAEGKLVSKSATYEVSVTGHVNLTAKFVEGATVSAVTSEGGTVSGTGIFPEGTEITLTAVPQNAETSFDGWYDSKGELLSTEKTYSMTVTDDTTIYAKFGGAAFVDVPLTNCWYTATVTEAVEKGLINGMVINLTFEPDSSLTRAQMAVLLARLDGADLNQVEIDAPFQDVATGAWFTAAINWAYDNKIITGRSEAVFSPEDSITREEFCIMLTRYLEWKGCEFSEDGELPFSDNEKITPSSLYSGSILKLYNAELVKGDAADANGNKTFRPKSSLSRAEGATLMVRAANYLAAYQKAAEDSDNAPSEEEIPETPASAEEAPTENP